MFKSIRIKNLRAITDLEIDNLGQVNLFVGRNNCGKTTVLEGVFFLANPGNPHLPIVANGARGLNSLSNELWQTCFHNLDADIPIELSGQEAGSQLQQTLSIRPRREQGILSEGAASDIVPLQGGTGHAGAPGFVTNGLNLEYVIADQGKKTASIVLAQGKLKTEPEVLKEAPFRSVFLTAATGRDWNEVFDSVQRKKQIPEVISQLRKIEPGILDLRLNTVGLLEVDIGIPGQLIPFNLTGGGTARFLSIVLHMLHCQNGVVLIDEIENGLHHSVQEILWRAIFTWAHDLNVQVFAATHSYECIKAFAGCQKEALFPGDGKLFRIEREDDVFKAVEFGGEDLAVSLEEMWEVR